MSPRAPLVFTTTLLAAAFGAASANAQPPSPELMAKLADFARKFEYERTHASFDVAGRLDTLDGDGKPDGTKELWGRVEADGKDTHLTVKRYLEDGKDKTEDAQKEAREAGEKSKEKRDKNKQLKMPIRAEEQGRYVFDQVETDTRDPSRVRITFVPVQRADDTVEGSAWVNAETGAPISAGFKLSRTPMFVDYVHFTVEFGADTRLGPAVSKVLVDGQGGILFFRKHFRATATLSGYTIVP